MIDFKNSETAKNLMADLPGAGRITVVADAPNRSTLTVVSGAEDIYTLSKGIFQSFAAGGYVLCELGVKKPSLEDIFLELTEGGEHS